MPWKNGLGISEEIAKDPELWRLSCAVIQGPTAFSSYPGKRRFLSVWKGESIKLNDFELKNGEVHAFDGDEPIFCSPGKGHVIDIGLIFDPKRVEANMKSELFKAEDVLPVDD